ncbi:cytochrome B [Shewanella sp. OPT22]|nr:cytochrome B [Shewanella sp. OPT22]
MRFAWFIRAAILLAFVVILMGAYTRLSNAGLGCPDWPGCYGQVTVPSQPSVIKQAEAKFNGQIVKPAKAWLEMIHRYLAGTLGTLILAILIYLWASKAASKKLALLLTVIVVFQAALGMWTVTMKLMPIVVMSHLLGGYTVIALLLLIYLVQRQKTSPIKGIAGKIDSNIQVHALLALIALIIQIILGGWTSTNYAALSCTSLPICQGNWFQHLQFAQAFNPFQGQHQTYEFGVLSANARTTIHVCHRIWAMVTSVVLLSLSYRLWHLNISSSKTMAIGLSLCLLLQVSLGISNILFQLPLFVAVAHNGGAVLLLLTMVFINFKLRSAS